MTAVASDARLPTSSSNVLQDRNADNVAEIIEERRKDADGRVTLYKYARGKMLGKVLLTSIKYVCNLKLMNVFNVFHREVLQNAMLRSNYQQRQCTL